MTVSACPAIVTDDLTIHAFAPAHAALNEQEHMEALAAFDDSKPERWRGDQALITGRFVQASIPNSNGHEFDLPDLASRHQTLVHTALNVGHVKPDIVGGFIATELDDSVNTVAGLGAPVVNAAAVFWKRNRPDAWDKAAAASDRRLLYFSMEAVGESITCGDHCGETFAWRGPTHPTYCAALQRIGPRAIINKPIFTGGALIIPPTRPGWEHAAIDPLVEAHAAEADAIYKAVAAHADGLSPYQWEIAMASLLHSVYPEELAKTQPRRYYATAFDPAVPEMVALAEDFDLDPITIAAKVGADACPIVTAAEDEEDDDESEDEEDESTEVKAAIVAEPSPETIALLTQVPAVTVEPSELHCTLAYLGEADVNDEEDGVAKFSVADKPARRVEAITAAIAAIVPPLAGTISAVTAWKAGEDGVAIVALLDVPHMAEARTLLTDALKGDDVPVSNTHGFTAHITLALGDPGQHNVADFAALEGQPVSFLRWGAWWGSLRHASYEAGVGLSQ